MSRDASLMITTKSKADGRIHELRRNLGPVVQKLLSWLILLEYLSQVPACASYTHNPGPLPYIVQYRVS